MRRLVASISPSDRPEASSGVFRVQGRPELVASMAFALHDAKNMACALQAGLEWLQTACTTGTHTELSEALDEMNEACQSLSGFLLDALRAARSGGDGLAVRAQKVDATELVRATVRRFRHRAELAGVSLVVESDGELVLEVDPELVVRVLDNLVDNALKASPPGSTVAIFFGRYAETAVLSVSDDGPGIALEDQSRIFELFVAGERSESSSGAGVGLAFCRRVAEAHGGHLTVDSCPGEGATFVLSLPYTE